MKPKTKPTDGVTLDQFADEIIAAIEKMTPLEKAKLRREFRRTLRPLNERLYRRLN